MPIQTYFTHMADTANARILIASSPLMMVEYSPAMKRRKIISFPSIAGYWGKFRSGRLLSTWKS